MPWIFLFLFIGALSAPAQPDDAPVNLIARIRLSKPDTIRISLLLRLGSYYLFKNGNYINDLDSAFDNFNKALDLSRALHSVDWVNATLKLKGDCYLEGEQLAAGEACFRKVIDHYHRVGNRREEAATWSRMGDCITIDSLRFFKDKIESYERARELYLQLGDTIQAILQVEHIADTHESEGKVDLAEKELLEVFTRLKAAHYSTLYEICDLLRDIYNVKGDLRSEIFYTMEMTKSLDTAAETELTEHYYEHIGASYMHAGMYDRGLFYFRKASQHDKGNFQGILHLQTACLIANALLFKDSVREALTFFSGVIAQRPPVALENKEYTCWLLGSCYSKLKEFKKAEPFFLQSAVLLDSGVRLGNHLFPSDWLFSHYVSIGEFYLATHAYEKANFYAGKIVLGPLDVLGVGVLGRLELFESRVDSAMGRYATALSHYEKYRMFNDSLHDVQKGVQLEELRIKYETEQKDKDLRLQATNIQLLTKQTHLQQSEVKASQAAKNMMIGALCSLLLSMGVLFNRYRLKQKSIRLLNEHQEIIHKKNEALIQVVQEKEILLREVHHRVKNNLHLVMSLLNSQSKYLKDEAALSAILESQHRVHSMSLVHQKLYKSDNFRSVYMPEYFGELVDYFKAGYKIGLKILFRLEIEPVFLDAEYAVPLGLILNETITNSIKYAFPYSKEDKITVSLSMAADGEVYLQISDNGKGLPANFDIERTGSFGMVLIKGLVADLRGNFVLESRNGTSLSLHFGTRGPEEKGLSLATGYALKGTA